jgi:hypothetical protein
VPCRVVRKGAIKPSRNRPMATIARPSIVHVAEEKGPDPRSRSESRLRSPR